MALLESVVQRDEAFDRRRERMEELLRELRERTAEVSAGGGEKATERHRSRGKLTARERIDRLVDPGGAFLELNGLAADKVCAALVHADVPVRGFTVQAADLEEMFVQLTGEGFDVSG